MPSPEHQLQRIGFGWLSTIEFQRPHIKYQTTFVSGVLVTAGSLVAYARTLTTVGAEVVAVDVADCNKLRRIVALATVGKS